MLLTSCPVTELVSHWVPVTSPHDRVGHEEGLGVFCPRPAPPMPRAAPRVAAHRVMGGREDGGGWSVKLPVSRGNAHQRSQVIRWTERHFPHSFFPHSTPAACSGGTRTERSCGRAEGYAWALRPVLPVTEADLAKATDRSLIHHQQRRTLGPGPGAVSHLVAG